MLPDQKLEMDLTIGSLPEPEAGVQLLWIETGLGFVPYTHMQITGDWDRISGDIVFSAEQSIKVEWEGKVGSFAKIAFQRTDHDQPVLITWNGIQETHNLNGAKHISLYILEKFDVGEIYFIPYILLFIVSFSYVLFALMIFTGNWDIRKVDSKHKNKFFWFRFALPMIFVWFLSLLILWPGILTIDSLSLYREAINRTFSNWHPAFYPYFLSIITRINPSPAFILSLQIILFAFISSWGLSVLEKNGVSNAILWIISFLIALFPPNLIYSITLWKDIPYALSLLLLSLFLLSIVSSGGKWGVKKLNWIWLGIVGFLVGIFRLNGAPTAFISLIILPLIFKKHWKFYAGSLLIAILLFVLVKGPLYNRIIDDYKSRGQSNLVYLHHIAAHIHQGTSLTKIEKQYLNNFLPLTEWNYSCCYVGTISYDRDFKRESFLKETKNNRQLALDLFSRNPAVDISHMLCAGELSYKFANNECPMKSLHGFINWDEGNEKWIGESEFQFKEQSFLPRLIQPFISLLWQFGFFSGRILFLFHPAFWLLIAIFSLSILVVRRRKILFITPVIAALSQSMILFLIGFAPAFRYYYSNCLVGIIFLGCLFIPKSELQGNYSA